VFVPGVLGRRRASATSLRAKWVHRTAQNWSWGWCVSRHGAFSGGSRREFGPASATLVGYLVWNSHKSPDDLISGNSKSVTRRDIAGSHANYALLLY